MKDDIKNTGDLKTLLSRKISQLARGEVEASVVKTIADGAMTIVKIMQIELLTAKMNGDTTKNILDIRPGNIIENDLVHNKPKGFLKVTKGR